MMNDIYYKINSEIMELNFIESDVEEKQKIIEKSLINYIIFKISELSLDKKITILEKEMNIENLMNTLGNIIPKKNHYCTLNHFIHYILNLSSSLQGYYITWCEEENKELINNPIIEFDEKGLCSSLKTHADTDYIKTFLFVYDIFKNKIITNDFKNIEMKINVKK